jgi:hypothetical protein
MARTGRFALALPIVTALLAGCGRSPPRGAGTPAGGTAPPATTAAAPAAPVAAAAPSWFTDMSAQAGVAFTHHSGDSSEKPFPSANGSGLAAFDYDLDRLPDLLLATGNPFPVVPATAPHTNRCYHNQGGWRFVEVTDRTGLGHRGYSHGVTVGDYDADGFPDVFITCFGPDVLYRNLGDGTFAQVVAGVEGDRWSSSAAFFDADADGLLDLYVCTYGRWSPEHNPYCGDRQRGVRVFCSPLTVEGEADALLVNAGDGAFRDATAAAGLTGPPGRGLGVVAARLDDDDTVDLYVANDLNPNHLLLGGGDGRFRDASDLSGTAYDGLGRVKSSMGVDAADTTGSGRFDLAVTDFEQEYNLLFSNSGGGVFSDSSERSGFGPPSLPLVSWGVQFADFDLDGLEDVVITSGHVGDERQKAAGTSALRQPGLVLHNRGGRFVAVPDGIAGSYFQARHQGRGLVAADLDGDGDADLAFNHRDEPAALLRNDAGVGSAAGQTAGTPLLVRLVGTRSNRDCVGAIARVAGTGPRQTRQVKGGGGYQSARDPRIVFAVPSAATSVDVEIEWPRGGRSAAEGLVGGSEYVVIEPATDGAAATIIDVGRLR